MKNMLSKTKKSYIILILSVVVLTSVLSFSLSYIKLKNTKANIFALGEVNVDIQESFDSENAIKKDVYIKNIGNVPCYVRAKILYYFVDNNGVILDETPVIDNDYFVDLPLDNWFYSDDGFYYYKKKLLPDKSTENLINECIKIKTYDDKIFKVDIVVQSIQAEPKSAVIEAWNVTVKNDEISNE